VSREQPFIELPERTAAEAGLDGEGGGGKAGGEGREVEEGVESEAVAECVRLTKRVKMLEGESEVLKRQLYEAQNLIARLRKEGEEKDREAEESKRRIERAHGEAQESKRLLEEAHEEAQGHRKMLEEAQGYLGKLEEAQSEAQNLRNRVEQLEKEGGASRADGPTSVAADKERGGAGERVSEVKEGGGDRERVQALEGMLKESQDRLILMEARLTASEAARAQAVSGGAPLRRTPSPQMSTAAAATAAAGAGARSTQSRSPHVLHFDANAANVGGSRQSVGMVAGGLVNRAGLPIEVIKDWGDSEVSLKLLSPAAPVKVGGTPDLDTAAKIIKVSPRGPLHPMMHDIGRTERAPAPKP
jgi:hypothetical protein